MLRGGKSQTETQGIFLSGKKCLSKFEKLPDENAEVKPQAREGFLSSRTRSISAKQINFHGRWQATHTLEQWLALRWPCTVMQGAGTWMKWDVEWQEGSPKSFGLLGIGDHRDRA